VVPDPVTGIGLDVVAGQPTQGGPRSTPVRKGAHDIGHGVTPALGRCVERRLQTLSGDGVGRFENGVGWPEGQVDGITHCGYFLPGFSAR
jgi:hypothetical protein